MVNMIQSDLLEEHFQKMSQNISFMPQPEDLKVTEPISPYAATKSAGEQLIYTYMHLFGIQSVCLRFFTV